MKTFKLLVLTVILAVCTAQKSQAQLAAGVVHDPVNNIVLTAMQTIQESGFMQVFNGVMAVAQVGQDVIEVASSLIDIYKSSQEVVVVSSKLIGIYEIYFDAIVYLSENIIYLDKHEFEYLVKTMDACAFRYRGDVTVRLRTPGDLAGGKLTETMNLLYAATTGGQISLFEINRLIKELSRETEKTYSDTASGFAYLCMAVETRKMQLGVYNIEDFIKTKNSR